jgi:hypothetical protein
MRATDVDARHFVAKEWVMALTRKTFALVLIKPAYSDGDGHLARRRGCAERARIGANV